jgi:hypothetical protein
VNHQGWMICDQETVFCWVPVHYLTMVLAQLVYLLQRRRSSRRRRATVTHGVSDASQPSDNSARGGGGGGGGGGEERCGLAARLYSLLRLHQKYCSLLLSLPPTSFFFFSF